MGDSKLSQTYKGGGTTPLSQKLSDFATASMNQQAAAIIKTVPVTSASIVSNPYADMDDLSKTTKNIHQPMSQQVSRQNSRSNLEDADIEEIAPEVSQKRVVKKKIIKKIIKRRNPDGTPAEVTTIVVSKDKAQRNQPANNLGGFNDSIA